MSMLDFSGQVAIVTGAGRGIGREVALGLARRGASVVVNDHGGSRDTLTPGSVDIAQSVVDEITAAGGTAVANGTAVGTGTAAAEIVNQALDSFGRIDVLINNAGGGLGITPIDEGTDEQVEGIVRTNLLGPFMLLRRAWPVMRQQGYGRIVNMMSGTLVGMIGTGAYSAGKAGLIGLTNTAAVEGGPIGVQANGIWPVAYTRLAGDLKDPQLHEQMKAFKTSYVAEAIIYLSSRASSVSGEMFTVRGGSVTRNALFTNEGFYEVDFTAESLSDRFGTAQDMTTSSLIPVVITHDREQTILEGQRSS